MQVCAPVFKYYSWIRDGMYGYQLYEARGSESHKFKSSLPPNHLASTRLSDHAKSLLMLRLQYDPDNYDYLYNTLLHSVLAHIAAAEWASKDAVERANSIARIILDEAIEDEEQNYISLADGFGIAVRNYYKTWHPRMPIFRTLTRPWRDEIKGF